MENSVINENLAWRAPWAKKTIISKEMRRKHYDERQRLEEFRRYAHAVDAAVG